MFENIYPQIVPTETYNIVRRKIESNKYGKQSTDTVYLLRNKMKCGYCGSSITAESGTSKTGKKKRYYKCIGRKHNNGCTKTMHRKEFLEEFVLQSIIYFLTDNKQLDEMVKKLLKYQDSLAKENIALNMLEREKRQCENSLENIMKAIERGIMNNTTNKRMTELEIKLDDLNKKLVIEKSKISVKMSEEDVKQYFLQALKLEAKLLISYLVKEIRLFNDKIQIQFNNPITKSPDNSQGFLLYSKTKKMAYSTANKPLTSLQYITLEMYI